MKQKYIPALIMLAAGAVTSILDIIHKTPKLDSLKRLLLVLIVFYIIGLITKAIIKKATITKVMEVIEEEHSTDENGQEENGPVEKGQERNRHEAAKNEMTGSTGKM